MNKEQRQELKKRIEDMYNAESDETDFDYFETLRYIDRFLRGCGYRQADIDSCVEELKI